jgi:hypothetical protein
VSLPIAQSAVGTHTYTAKFNGDTNYSPSTSAPMTTRVFYGTTTSLSPDSSNIQYGTSITLTAVVHSNIAQGPAITQSVNFLFDNDPVSGTVSYTPFTDSSGDVALRASLTTVPQSSGFYTANFVGDSNYSQSGALVNVTVNIPDFSLSANLPVSSITAGSSAMATITVTPASNASSPVTLACPPVNPLLGQTQPLGISCSFSPGSVNLSGGSAAASTLTISTLAPSSSTTTSFDPPQLPPIALPLRPNWPLLLVPILLFLFLLMLSNDSERSRLATATSLACSLCLLLGFFGCGGGSASVGGPPGPGGGPVPTSITLTASSVKVPYSSISGGAVNLTANVTASKTPGGMVTFVVDGNTRYTAPVPVAGGVAQFQLTGLSVGVHAISAQYSGDTNTLGSQTKGSLNVAVTGQTEIGIQGTTGGLIHATAVNFTLQ